VRIGISLMYWPWFAPPEQLALAARQPTTAAMVASTVDRLSGGRMLLGLGLSGPQVSEG
jgi:hypothetical protein